MHEMIRLRRNLTKMGIDTMHISKGPEWNNLSKNQRAEVINEVLEAIQRGDHTPVDLDDIDGPCSNKTFDKLRVID